MVDSKHKWKAWLYLAPALVLLAVFTVWPIINTIRIAFLEGYQLSLANRYGEQYFSYGFGNFTSVLNPNSGFNNALKNTILMTVITVPVSTILALLISVVLNSIGPLKRLLQTIYFLPYVTNSIAIGLVFASMFAIISPTGGFENYESLGLVNNIITAFGGDPINWIGPGSSYEANLFVMCVYIVWNALPFKILILLGGLQSVNKQYYDAAKVDGTSKFRTLTRITVPLLSPMITYVVITGFIGGFKEYSSVVAIFGESMGPSGSSVLGTPGGSMNTMVGIIQKALIADTQGKASAAALILFAIILVVTLINLQVSKKRTHY